MYVYLYNCTCISILTGINSWHARVYELCVYMHIHVESVEFDSYKFPSSTGTGGQENQVTRAADKIAVNCGKVPCGTIKIAMPSVQCCVNLVSDLHLHRRQRQQRQLQRQLGLRQLRRQLQRQLRHRQLRWQLQPRRKHYQLKITWGGSTLQVSKTVNNRGNECWNHMCSLHVYELLAL